MTEASQTAAPAAAASGQTAGQMLRQLREQAGADPLLMASALKVTPQKLQALEEDRLDDLPDLTFARALAAAQARALGADPAAVLALMPRPHTGLGRAQPINEAFQRAGDQPAPMVSPRAFKTVLLLALGGLLLAALLWFLPALPRLGAAPAADAASATATDNGMTSEPVLAQLPAGAEVAEQGAAPQAGEAASAAAQAASAPALAASQAQASADEVHFAASAQTWLTVRDAKGVSLINRSLNAGESVALSGAFPLAVTVSRKDAVAITVRGEPFAIPSRSRAATARFQIQ